MLVNNSEIIAKLIVYRDRACLSQVKVAKFLGVSRLQILRWENNQSNISERNAKKLEKLLEFKRCRTCGKII